MVTAFGVRLISLLHKEGSEIQMERDAQALLYNVTKEIRSSQYIISVSSNVLQLRVYDLRFGYDSGTNPGMFNTGNSGTITYRHENNAGVTVLRKTIAYPGRVRDDLFLQNMVSTAAGTEYMFKNLDSRTTCPCYAAQVRFRLDQGWFKKSPKIYGTEASVRSSQ